MLIAILERRKTVWQGKHKTGEQLYFHFGPSIRVNQEKKYLFNKKKNILYDTIKHDQIHQYFTNLDQRDHSDSSTLSQVCSNFQFS